MLRNPLIYDKKKEVPVGASYIQKQATEYFLSIFIRYQTFVMKKYLPLLLLVLAACQNNPKTPKTADEVLKEVSKIPGMNAGVGKFNITVPEGWQRLDTSLNGVDATFLFAPLAKDGFRTNINVVSEFMHGTSLDEYYKKNVGMMAQYMQDFAEGATSEKEINGSKVKFLEYSHSQNGLNMDVIMALIPKNGVAYVITVTAPKGKRADFRKQFDDVVNSFSVS